MSTLVLRRPRRAMRESATTSSTSSGSPLSSTDCTSCAITSINVSTPSQVASKLTMVFVPKTSAPRVKSNSMS